MKEQKFLCCDKLRKRSVSITSHLPQTWKSVYVVKFGSAEESECGSVSAKIFLETWNTKSTAQYNFCEVTNSSQGLYV